MTRVMTLSVAVILSFAVFAEAGPKTKAPASGGNSNMNYGKGKGKNSGLVGTISSLGSSGFLLTVEQKKTTPKVVSSDPTTPPPDSSDNKTQTIVYKVLCDNNTVFSVDGVKDSPTSVKQGATVSVVGATSGDNLILATMVDVKSTPDKAKGKKKPA